MASSGKIKVVLVASEWSSRKSGLSSLNRELAIQLAKHAKVDFFSSSRMRPDRKERSKEQQRHPSSGRTHTWLWRNALAKFSTRRSRNWLCYRMQGKAWSSSTNNKKDSFLNMDVNCAHWPRGAGYVWNVPRSSFEGRNEVSTGSGTLCHGRPRFSGGS